MAGAGSPYGNPANKVRAAGIRWTIVQKFDWPLRHVRFGQRMQESQQHLRSASRPAGIVTIPEGQDDIALACQALAKSAIKSSPGLRVQPGLRVAHFRWQRQLDLFYARLRKQIVEVSQ